MDQADTLDENPVLKETVQASNSLKSMLVQHAGDKLSPKDNNVTVEMIIEVMAEEFPEFVMALAEENWIRGYEQGLDDVQTGKMLMEQEN
tara:strand:- start:5594 stop:5863 length:270 start_codon:yes stop_codon:yes gene_type:complete